jgi:hypothetical protein
MPVLNDQHTTTESNLAWQTLLRTVNLALVNGSSATAAGTALRWQRLIVLRFSELSRAPI